jgi:tetratricopeptide (TPR) repeat protein
MTFGRWLLVHSFSIFLVTLLVVGYVYREELRLQQAYQQLLGLGPEASLVDAGDGRNAKPVPTMTDLGSAEGLSRSQVPEVVKPVDPPTEEASQRQAPKHQEILPLLTEPRPTIEREVIELDGLLIKARREYWKKQFNTSIESYRQLIEQQPHNADLRGELGNVFYAMNDYTAAANHYYEAADLLIKQGKINRARQLLAPITAMQRQLGDRLESRLKHPQN